MVPALIFTILFLFNLSCAFTSLFFLTFPYLSSLFFIYSLPPDPAWPVTTSFPPLKSTPHMSQPTDLLTDTQDPMGISPTVLPGTSTC